MSGAVERPEGHVYDRSRIEKTEMSGAARSSFEETTFGQNSGSGPNRSRDVSPSEAKKKPTLPARASRELGRSPKPRPKIKEGLSPKSRRELGVPSWEK